MKRIELRKQNKIESPFGRRKAQHEESESMALMYVEEAMRELEYLD